MRTAGTNKTMDNIVRMVNRSAQAVILMFLLGGIYLLA